jgi:voltage-gated potassium channel
MSDRGVWRERVHEIIFETDTPAGKTFDVVLLVVIVLSVVAVVLESVPGLSTAYGPHLRAVEWIFTGLFTVEYALRIATTNRPARYVFSAFGIIDLLSIVPTYLSLFFAGTQSLLVIRALRLLRVFRVLKLVRFVGEARMLGEAMRASARKIFVFLFFVLTLVVIIGSVMYLVEGRESGFTSIPVSIYWTIVTMTTVGYGDLAPQTVLGRVIASVVMILGYGIIAVPTGIVTVEMAQGRQPLPLADVRVCRDCGVDGHDDDAMHCKRCGARL